MEVAVAVHQQHLTIEAFRFGQQLHEEFVIAPARPPGAEILDVRVGLHDYHDAFEPERAGPCEGGGDPGFDGCTALHELVAHFGTTLAALSGQEDRSTGESLIRSGNWSTWPATSSRVTVQILSEGKNQMECHRFVLAPGASSEGAYQHEGEEFLHLLSGKMEIVLDGDQFFELSAGDSFYFESKRPHSWRNSFAGETVLIWVNTPPTF